MLSQVLFLALLALGTVHGAGPLTGIWYKVIGTGNFYVDFVDVNTAIGNVTMH